MILARDLSVFATLSHQYTTRALKLANLKGNDYYKARSIADACSIVGHFTVFLADLENFVTLVNDEGCEDEQTSQLRLHNVVDIEGSLLQLNLTIPENFLLQARLYDSRAPDQRGGGEYMGNQHAELEEHYNDTVGPCDRHHNILLLSLTGSAHGFQSQSAVLSAWSQL